MTGGFSRYLRLWRTHDLCLLHTYPPCDGSIRALTISTDQRYVTRNVDYRLELAIVHRAALLYFCLSSTVSKDSSPSPTLCCFWNLGLRPNFSRRNNLRSFHSCLTQRIMWLTTDSIDVLQYIKNDFHPYPRKRIGGGGDGGGINEFIQLERRGNKFMQRLQYAKYLTFWIVIPHFLFLGVWLLDWLQAVSWPLPWTSRAVFDLNFTFPPQKNKYNKKQDV